MAWGLPALSAIAAALMNPDEASRAWGGFDQTDPREEKDAPGIASFEIVDVEHRAASATYGNGKNKRRRYPLVDLSNRRVLIGLHQVGVERSESRWRQTMHRVTAHRGIGPTGVRYRIHPLTTRLVATNRLDRDPWACIAVEFAGNFEGLDGSGRWYKPERFGHGRASDAQLSAGRAEVRSITREVQLVGGRVEGIVPHIIAGRDRYGRPNRQICPGSRVWSEVGEWAGAELGLAVPGPGFEVGGLEIPAGWHGPHWEAAQRNLLAA